MENKYIAFAKAKKAWVPFIRLPSFPIIISADLLICQFEFTFIDRGITRIIQNPADEALASSWTSWKKDIECSGKDIPLAFLLVLSTVG